MAIIQYGFIFSLAGCIPHQPEPQTVSQCIHPDDLSRKEGRKEAPSETLARRHPDRSLLASTQALPRFSHGDKVAAAGVPESQHKCPEASGDGPLGKSLEEAGNPQGRQGRRGRVPC